MMRRLRQQLASARAFTLTEMLVVIGIIGVLGGVAVWSVAGLQDVADTTAADLAEGGVALRADAARGALLTVAGIELQPLPALLPEPQLGPTATTLTVDPTAGSSPINDTVVFTVAVADQVDDPFEGAQVRYELAGISTLSGAVPLPTGPDGTTTWSYSRTVSGNDTLTLCTNADGTLPGTCAEATGPTVAATRAWTLPRPVLVSWERANNAQADIVWSLELGSTFNVSGYVFYDTAGACSADTSPQAASSRSVESVAANGQTTIRVDSGGVDLNPGQVGNRRLRILADTETNTDSIGNLATGCLAVGSVPEPADLAISPSAGASEVGDSVELTFVVTDSNGDGYAGALVRYEISGISDLNGSVAATNADGQTTLTYSRSTTGADTIVACTNADGSLPADCATASGPSGSAEREWTEDAPPPLPAPIPVSWTRASNSTVDVVWDRELGGTFNIAGYVFYTNAQDCTNSNNPFPATTRSVQGVAGDGQTTIRVNSGGLSVNPGQVGNRRLRILLATETNVEGTGNVATGCLAAG